MTPALASPALTGLATGLSLIVAIGAQNAYVLRQGLTGRHVFWLCLLCAASDAVLIAAGVAGFAAMTQALPWLPRAMALAGAAFLVFYGITRLRAALKGGETLEAAGQGAGLARTLLIGATFTWANPHVYLDTLGLVGAVSTRFDGPARLAFALGAMTASVLFFFSLGYGARFLAPLMRKPRAWQVLDLVIAFTMFTLAAGLIRQL